MGTFTVRLSDREAQILSDLYKRFSIDRESESERFRELLDSLHAFFTGSQKELAEHPQTLVGTESCQITTEQESLQELESWDCSFRAAVFVYNKYRHREELMVHCSAMNTRRILGTNFIPIEVCVKCHIRGADSPFIALPSTAKTPILTSPKPIGPIRHCEKCGADISSLPTHYKLCRKCYWLEHSPEYQGEGKPLKGSPLDLAQQKTRRAELVKEENDRLYAQKE